MTKPQEVVENVIDCDQKSIKSIKDDSSSKDCMPLIKKEGAIKSEVDLRECLLCANKSEDHYDIYCTETSCGHTSLFMFVCKFTNVNLADKRNFSKFMCKCCYELVNILEQAEIEYSKLKESFEAIIGRNPLFGETNLQTINIDLVKTENFPCDYYTGTCEEIGLRLGGDSDDEPLAITKKKRRRKSTRKKRKSTNVLPKRKNVFIESNECVENDSELPIWECNICNERADSSEGIADHILRVHHINSEQRSDVLLVQKFSDVKIEPEKKGSESPNLNDEDNFECSNDNDWKVEIDESWTADISNEQDESLGSDDSTIGDSKNNKEDPIKCNAFEIVGEFTGKKLKRALLSGRKPRKAKSKIEYSCDQCNATYTSLVRLRQHLVKHDTIKPPFICEVCGAHYKHKKACDIHVALHKGISDWKCEECNKLFPSKGALQRHNNIHTGKSNYQCDLCGKSFIHTSSFKMHKLSHTGLKPHSCDVCGLALMTRSHLKRHKRVHSGEKRHECTICGKRFSERYNLAAHLKSHEATNTPVVPQPRRRLFRCVFCDERFERRYMLERHMEIVHERSLERPPPKPRNTMTKLLKAQAQAAAQAGQKEKPAPTAPADLKSELAAASQNDSDASKAVVRPLVLVVMAGGEGGGQTKSGEDKPPTTTTTTTTVSSTNSTTSSSTTTTSTPRPITRSTDGCGVAFQGAWSGVTASATYTLTADYALRMQDFQQ